MSSTLADDIFSTVSKKDYLDLTQGDQLQYNRIKEILGFRNNDIARATGHPANSIRFDDRIPPEVQQRMLEWANLLNLVAGHFEGDARKTTLWFTTPNPLLGSMAPRDMIRLGRYKKLYQFIFNALVENRR